MRFGPARGNQRFGNRTFGHLVLAPKLIAFHVNVEDAPINALVVFPTYIDKLVMILHGIGNELRYSLAEDDSAKV